MTTIAPLKYSDDGKVLAPNPYDRRSSMTRPCERRVSVDVGMSHWYEVRGRTESEMNALYSELLNILDENGAVILEARTAHVASELHLRSTGKPWGMVVIYGIPHPTREPVPAQSYPALRVA